MGVPVSLKEKRLYLASSFLAKWFVLLIPFPCLNLFTISLRRPREYYIPVIEGEEKPEEKPTARSSKQPVSWMNVDILYWTEVVPCLIIECFFCKDSFTVNVPTCDTVISTHLDTATIDACLRKDHKPINPHSQRLLTAEARAVSKLPAGEAKAKATAKAKGKKAKAQAEAKEAEDNGEAGEEPQDGEEEPTEPPAKKAKKDKKQKDDLEKQKESGVLRSKYSAVKLAFFDQPSLPS